MMVQAERQHNLPGQIALDELPTAGRIYSRPARQVALASEEVAATGDKQEDSSDSVQVGSDGLTPNLFENFRDIPEESFTPPQEPVEPENPTSLYVK